MLVSVSVSSLSREVLQKPFFLSDVENGMRLLLQIGP